jgi:hypothetical protein
MVDIATGDMLTSVSEEEAALAAVAVPVRASSMEARV